MFSVRNRAVGTPPSQLQALINDSVVPITRNNPQFPEIPPGILAELDDEIDSLCGLDPEIGQFTRAFGTPVDSTIQATTFLRFSAALAAAPAIGSDPTGLAFATSGWEAFQPAMPGTVHVFAMVDGLPPILLTTASRNSFQEVVGDSYTFPPGLGIVGSGALLSLQAVFVPVVGQAQITDLFKMFL